ncbi:hypothetical protein [Dactylosporangium sp. NPDC051484]|uniref:hypothetical protein n=1 Tax=Dactylosporangium sp. NPDC051484 TaxID=3154942 RepID=UPI0034506BF7
MTVGPHPPSVYWRRRALVAVGAAILVLLGWLAVRGSGGTPAAVSSAPTAPTSGTGASGTSAPGDLPSPSFVQATTDTSTTPTAVHGPPPSNVTPCGDDQIAVTVAASPSPGVVGGTFTFSVAIVSKADDWCSRDLGSGAQEIQVLHNGALLYSSDDCRTGTGHTSDVRAFAAGDAVRYRYPWSSYRITPHECALAKTPAPPGTYQVVARVGTKISAPVDFTINR